MKRPCWTCGHQLEIPEGAIGWSFTLPISPPSQNEAVSANRGPARFAYAKRRDHWRMLLSLAKNTHSIPVASGRRRVLITRLYHGRQKVRDPSNLAGGCKMVLDAMVSCGLLVDDAEAWIEAHYYQHPANGEGTWIELIELGGADVETEAGAATKGQAVEEAGRSRARGRRRSS